eukprot:Blabericola_migrator_1__1442@NODE_137_length_13158_cov_138_292491_g119_i0_p8_GENE_NODE_137_length_13158_cov_138_292491_g119_i0NODE_137_length_13158_cov_138_292491_g119_i0_p8_ORF_typecomplete_len125_score24_99GET2/PF08690_10/0_34_NODE_137_length_13158_cov_138_292491_g119_i061976571
MSNIHSFQDIQRQGQGGPSGQRGPSGQATPNPQQAGQQYPQQYQQGYGPNTYGAQQPGGVILQIRQEDLDAIQRQRKKQLYCMLGFFLIMSLLTTSMLFLTPRHRHPPPPPEKTAGASNTTRLL